MRIAVVSTYPPRRCGIAQFSLDLRAALIEADTSITVDVVAIVREPISHQAPEVVATVRRDEESDYVAAARALARRGADVVLIEHEYYLFGGEEGAFVLCLMERLREPLVVTLHTVLSRPAPQQAERLRALGSLATLITVFTESVRQTIVDAGVIAPVRVRVLPHGAPTLLRSSLMPHGVGTAEAAGRRIGTVLGLMAGRTVLLTFGLIHANKGIEYAIRALPEIVHRHPEVIYVVARQTHPEVLMVEGERCRHHLEQLVRDVHLTEHVQFLDWFLTDEEIAFFLHETTLYLTPYRSSEQAVSGALTFAMLAGCPTISTSYAYASDLLGSSAGVLVPFDDPPAIAAAVLRLLDDADALAAARFEASQVGAKLGAERIGKLALEVLTDAVQLGRSRHKMT